MKAAMHNPGRKPNPTQLSIIQQTSQSKKSVVVEGESAV